MPRFGFRPVRLGPGRVDPAEPAGIGGQPVEGRPSAGVHAAAAADVDRLAPAVVAGAGIGAHAALLVSAHDLLVVRPVAVGDADVLPEYGPERTVHLVERGRRMAFEQQLRRGRDRTQCRGGDLTVAEPAPGSGP